MMVLYEVSLTVEASLHEALDRYMREKHIPEILALGCFEAAEFSRTDQSRFRTAYRARNQAGLDRYLADHAAHYREDFARHFPEGIAAERRVWTVIQSWS
jgi:hypothetical protein